MFENFSYGTINHNPLTTPTTDDEYENYLKESATSFLNPPHKLQKLWSLASFSGIKHSYKINIVGAEYVVNQEYLNDDNGLDPQWIVEVLFNPIDTGHLILNYDSIDKTAKISWVKTEEGIIVSDFEGYEVLINKNKLVEYFIDDTEVITMAEIINRLKRKRIFKF